MNLITKILFVRNTQSCKASLALLILRVIAGLAFMFHGWGKIQNPMGWMGPDATIPGIFQALAAISEFGGGLAWIIGLLTPLASLGIFSTMCVALRLHIFIKEDPFVGHEGSFELPLLYWGIAILFFTVGAGKISLDHFLFRNRQ